MKKKLWIIAGVLVLCIVLGVFFWVDRYKLNADKIDRISFGNASTAPVLNEEETAKFIELFNAADYAGEGTGEGCTPDWSVYVYCKDGSHYLISEFCKAGGMLEVSHRYPGEGTKAWFYVQSTEFYDFILEMMDKY